MPFLGAGASNSGIPFSPRATLPQGSDLAAYLSQMFLYPKAGDDLLRVAQYVATMHGYRDLNETLHELFDADFTPTSLHVFLAGLPTLLSGSPAAERSPDFTKYQVIVTTNYDDTLERAFRAVDEPYDLITYKAGDAKRRQPGMFLHWPLGRSPRPVEMDEGGYCHDLALDERTLIMKMHGVVARKGQGPECESFVITEDHYIDYLASAGLSKLVPVQVFDRLVNSRLLFVGYALKDWNLRVILQSIWMERAFDVPAWALQLEPDDFDEEFWRDRGISIFDIPIDTYVEKLGKRLQELRTASR